MCKPDTATLCELDTVGTSHRLQCMDAEILVPFALTAFAIVLRSQKRRDRIDWRSRVELAVLSALICLFVGLWIHDSVLNAAESALSTGRSVHSIASDIARHYDPALMPLYIAGLAVAIDLLSRLVRVSLVHRLKGSDRRTMLWRAMCANCVVFVLAPGVLYAWTATFASSGSMIDDAAQNGVMPFIVAYTTPNDWLARLPIHAFAAQSAAVDNDVLHEFRKAQLMSSATLRARFWSDAAPWFTLAVLLACATAIVRPSTDSRKLLEYFIARTRSSPTRFVGSLFSTWRGIAAICFTLAWMISAALSRLFLQLLLGLQFIWMPLLAVAVLAGLIGIPVWVARTIRARRVKRPTA